ncbi:glycoside hydrolase family 76 protein [Cellulosimicrobium arenosum]|uniref:AGE family epimerase/isomerase n=1 Tax=Cellulosimicrobium arenosum TaxID=2708133 RepID=A0A927IZ49_9MICO|nr:glycoside hydrolase family 76 protein [Cellulosimicrobium arenosum]MBD8078265.1 AGE family epimerase/isomerase [Cellulosimicrobium arenosum]
MKSSTSAGAVAALACVLGAAVPAAAAPAADSTQLERAVASYEAMQDYLYVDDGSSLYLEQYPRTAQDRPYSYEWPFSQAHVATLDLAVLPEPVGSTFADDLADRGRGQEHFWNADGGATGLPGYDSYPRSPYGDGGDIFYDDNEWVALAKVQQYLERGDDDALERAEEIFDLVVTGWDTDPTHPAPGGVFWTQATWSTDRNTVSTMPAAQLATRLYMVTGEDEYLDWAERMTAWTDRYLLAPNGLYWDNVALDGSIDRAQWSYNQGVPVGTYTLLYQATGDEQYLHKAKAIASDSYRFYVTEGRLQHQPMFFNSIWFKNLLLLESVTGGETYRDAMADYADAQWRDVRDPETGLFPVDGETTELLGQAAMVQIYAALARPSGTRDMPVSVQTVSRCLAGDAYVAVRATNDGTEPVDVTLSTPFGKRAFAEVAGGRSAYQSFASRGTSIEAGDAVVTATAVADGEEVTFTVTYDELSCS